MPVEMMHITQAGRKFAICPVAATLANLLPEESIDFHFVTLDFYLL